VDAFSVNSDLTLTKCSAFVADFSLDDWEWMVRAQDTEGNLSEWSEIGAFGFEPCRLGDGSPCRTQA